MADDKATTVVGAPATLALPSTEVAKTYPVDFDLASLAAFDLAPFDSHARDGQELDDRLKTLARDNAQLLFNKIFSLPVTVTDDGVLAQLPPQTTLIPRAKPIPTGKPMTRWETFAKAKGIKKVKRSHKVYDETSGDYKPRYGFKAGASKDVPEDWIVEVPKSADPNEDVRAKAKEAKTERIEKNKRQQLRNQTESRKTLLAPSLSTASGSDVSRSQRKERLKTAFATSRVSTASMGKFDRTVEGEESVKIPRAKRKFESVAGDIEAEKGVAMKLAKFVEKKTAKDVINTSKATVKELIENCLDANATSINLLVRDAGLKLLQVQDNGSGIARDDLPRVCERFATSKLTAFEELEEGKVNTYGFRGEALASISHVAHVTITTRVREDESGCAWRACYSDGVLVPGRGSSSSDPKPVAGNPGTQITIEDLFFNVPTRRKALKSVSEEYAKIIDVVHRYAIHNSKVSFTCKKYATNSADVATPQDATAIDNIRIIFGASVAKELLPLSMKDEKLEFELEGLVSNANYNMKKFNLLLFINIYIAEVTTASDEATNSQQGPAEGNEEAVLGDEPTATQTEREMIDVQLTSILDLRKEFRDASHLGMTELLRGHSFVGLVDHRLALIQFHTKLFIVNYEELSAELFYQLSLRGFANFGTLRLTPPLSIYDLVMIGLEEESLEGDGAKAVDSPDPTTAQKIQELLVSRGPMLLEYFAMKIDQDGNLHSLPVILRGYQPNLAKLPLFLLRLGSEVDWSEEKACFEGLSRELGYFYSCDMLPPIMNGESTGVTDAEYTDYCMSVEHVVFKALRHWYNPSEEVARQNVVIQVADLPELYKVFERC
ncbi:DNA mismatch repair protein [Cladochytrium tenue]|nr:DNA mismatch repair protein [Cladochytrium tenue]